jgi:bacterioferritin-associated ferredoxin
MYVCLCHCIRDRDLEEAARAGVRSFDELKAATRVSTGCGRCETAARHSFHCALDPASPTVHPA